MDKLLLADIFTTRKEDLLVSCQLIVEGFARKNLKFFDISNNALCPDGCDIISKLFASNQSIRYLWMNHVAFSRDGTIAVSKAITESGLKLRSLQVVKNRMFEKGDHFGKMLAGQTDLTELIMFQNDLKAESLIDAARSIRNISNLQTLDISDNFFDEETFAVFCESLVYLKNLKHLNVSDCNIDEEGTRVMIAALRQIQDFSELESFKFNYNEVAEEDVAVFFEVLNGFKNLKRVEFKVDLEEDAVQLAMKELEELGEDEVLFESEDDMDATVKSESPEEKKESEEREWGDLLGLMDKMTV